MKPDKSRRQFLTFDWLKNNRHTTNNIASTQKEKKKMLMADGTLVEVEFTSTNKIKKATNQEILNWMKSPKIDSNNTK